MRYLTRAIIMILSGISFPDMAAAQEPSDTVASIDKTTNVIVTRLDNTTVVEAELGDTVDDEVTVFRYEVNVDTARTVEISDTWGLDLPFFSIDDRPKGRSRKLRRSVIGMNHIYWGWRFNYHDKGNVRNCFELGIKELIGVSFSRGKDIPEISFGLGIGMQRYLTQDGFCFDKDHYGRLSARRISDDYIKVQSRLDVITFHVPVMITQKIGKHGSFSIAGIMNLNSYAKVNNRFERKNYVEKERIKGLQQRLFTAELFASIGIGGFAVYGSWQPVSLFRAPYGPELKGWSIGIDLHY